MREREKEDGVDSPPSHAARAFPAPGRPAGKPTPSGRSLQWPPSMASHMLSEQIQRWPDADAVRDSDSARNGLARGRSGTVAEGWLRDEPPRAAAGAPRTRPRGLRLVHARDQITGIDAEMADRSPIRQVPGAPPGMAGRFAAEWCPSGATSRRHSLQHEGGRTGGGVMVRRATLDPEEALADEDQVLPPTQFPAQRGRQWQGAGGRWLVWVGRVVAWAVLLLIGYRGVLAIVTGQDTSGKPAATAAAARPAAAFPVSLAQAYALQFGAAYLNFSPAGAAQRARELTRFLPAGTSPQLGWNGAGTQRLQSEQVAGTSVTSAHSAVVTLLASIDSGRLIELAVPIYASHGGISVSGEPALLPAPPGAPPPAASPAHSDPSAEAALQAQLPAFFSAYASGDRTTLARFTTADAHIDSLGGAVTFAGIDSVFAPAGGARRTITVTVTWKLAPAPGGRTSRTITTSPASLQMAYQLTVVRQGATWDVRSIGALTQGPP
jgi:Conjugative transposon protein TcpC